MFSNVSDLVKLLLDPTNRKILFFTDVQNLVLNFFERKKLCILE